MKRKSMRVLSLALVAAVAVSVNTGFSNASAAKPAMNPQVLTKNKVTLKILASNQSLAPADPNKMLIWQRYEKATGVHIQWISYTSDSFSDKMHLMMASGNLPDAIFQANMSDADVLHYASQGLVIPVQKYIKNDMPNFQKILASRFTSASSTYKQAMTAPDGNIYSFPWIEELGAGPKAIQAMGAIPFINKSWLNELGLKMPTTTAQLENVLKTFKAKKANCIPMSFVINDWNEEPGMLLGAFGDGTGDTGDHYVVTNKKKVVYTLASDSVKQGIIYLHKLYSEGLIDPEVFTQKYDSFAAKGANNRYGLFFSWDSSVAGKPNDYVPLPALKGPTGMINVPRQDCYGFTRGEMVITSANKNKDLTAKWIDGLYAPLQSIQDDWGTYGDTKNQNIFTLTSSHTLKHLPLGNASPWDVRCKQAVFGPLAVMNSYFGKYVTFPGDAKVRTDDVSKVYSKEMHNKYIYPPVFLDTKTSEKLNSLENAVKPLAEGQESQWILKGGAEQGWSKYISSLNKAGLKQLISIKQKAMDDYNKKK